MSKAGVVIAIIVLVSSNLFFIDLITGDLSENGDRLPEPILNNDGLLSQDIEMSDPEARSPSRDARFIEQNAHGGSWLDSFEDDSGIDTSQSDNYILNYKGVRILKEDNPLQADDNTVALWHFDDGIGTTLTDETTNNNDGSIIGATWSTGKFGNALEFDGNNDYVNVPHSSSLVLNGPFTIEAWVQITGNSKYMAIVDKYENSPSDNGYSFYPTYGNNRLTIYSGTGNSGNIVGTTNLQDGQWHYVVCENDGSYSRIFADGNLEEKNYRDVPPTSSTISLGIGRRISGWGGDMEFIGKIDEIRISNIARSKINSFANVTSTAIPIPPDMKWDSVLINKTKEEDLFLNISILNAADDQQIPGSPLYLENGEFDISYIDSDQYPSIKLKAEYIGSYLGPSPVLDHWGVSWKASDSWRDTFFYLNNNLVSDNIELTEGDVQLKNEYETRAIGMWHMDEGSGLIAYDSSPNTNDAFLSGASWSIGKFNGALDFDGIDDNIQVNDEEGLNFDLSDFSLEAWFYLDVLPNQWTSIISKGASGDIGYGIEISDTNQIIASIQCGYNSEQNQHLYGSVITAQKWYHVIAVYDRGNQIFLYLDGQYIGSTNYANGNTGSISSESPFKIGSHSRNKKFFNGKIDEVAVYNKVLTTNDVKKRYENGPKLTGNGNFVSALIPIPQNMHWNTLVVNKTEFPDTFINISILNGSSQQLIEHHENLIGNKINLNSVNPMQFPTIRVQASFQSNGLLSPVLHDLAINTTTNNKPDKIELLSSSNEVYRTSTIILSIKASDKETPEESLIIDIDYRKMGTSIWQNNYLTDLNFLNDSWLLNFTPMADADIGFYQFKVICKDVFSESLILIFDDVVDVVNNLPGPPLLEINPKEPTSTDDLTVTAKNSIDIENEHVTYFYQWYKNDVLQENLTATLITASYTTKGDIWRCDVTPNDGNPGGNGTINSTSVVILNTPPVVSKDIERVELNEDEIDNSSIDIEVVFADADEDILAIKFTGHDKIDVAVRSSGIVILTPADNWFGTEFITFTANDTEFEVNITIKVDVKSVNDPPKLLKAGDEDVKSRDETVEFSVYEDNTLDLTFITEDIDGDTVTITSNRTDNVDIRDNVAKMTLKNGLLEFNPDNSHVGPIPIDLFLSDDNGSDVVYKLLIIVVNTNDPPTASITYPTNGMLFTEGEPIHFTCEFTDPDLLVPDSIEIIYFKWSTNRNFDPLGEGANLDNFTWAELEPGTHLITLTVRDDTGSQVTDTITITIEKKEEASVSSFWGTQAGALFIVVIIIVAIIIVLFLVFIRRRRIRAEVEYIPPGEQPEAGTFVAKPGAIAPPTVTMEQVPGAAEPGQLLPSADAATQQMPAGEAQVQAPEPSPPYDMPQGQLPPLGGVVEIEAQAVEEVEAEKLPDFGIEGGPKPVHQPAVYHDVSEAKPEEPPDTEAATADLLGAGEVKATEETVVVHEGDKGVWKPDERGKAADRDKELEQTGTVLEQIEKLGELKEKGLITEEEFQLKKSELLK